MIGYTTAVNSRQPFQAAEVSRTNGGTGERHRAQYRRTPRERTYLRRLTLLKRVSCSALLGRLLADMQFAFLNDRCAFSLFIRPLKRHHATYIDLEDRPRAGAGSPSLRLMAWFQSSTTTRSFILGRHPDDQVLGLLGDRRPARSGL